MEQQGSNEGYKNSNNPTINITIEVVIIRAVRTEPRDIGVRSMLNVIKRTIN